MTSVKLKEKRNVVEFDLKNVSAKKHKERKQACILKALFLSKNIFCPYFSPIVKLNNKKSQFLSFHFLKVLQDLNSFKTEVPII